ncbi:MAG: hypothetical protein ACFFAO_19670 [Candidatus Hermodarchaeota archaeon]
MFSQIVIREVMAFLKPFVAFFTVPFTCFRAKDVIFFHIAACHT